MVTKGKQSTNKREKTEKIEENTEHIVNNLKILYAMDFPDEPPGNPEVLLTS